MFILSANPRMKIKNTILCLAAALVLGTTGISAQTNDFGTWCSLQAIKIMGKGLATVRVEHRSYDKLSSTQNFFVVLGGAYNFTKWLQLEGGYEYWRIPAAGEMQSHRAVLGLIGTVRREGLAVSFRGKYELCFNTVGQTPTGDTRWRLKAQYTFSENSFRPYLMYEMFNGFGGKGWIRSLNYLGTEVSLDKHNSLDLFYMYHLYPTASGIGSCHLLGAGYFFIF